ncbi:MAG: nodulation protein NfeD [Thermodesulfobacteriota bacterium]
MNLKKAGLFLLCFFLYAFALGPALAQEGQKPEAASESAPETPPRDVYVMKLNGVVNPATAAYVIRHLALAEEAKASCVIIEMDTPGGLMESMRAIIQKILACPVPVVVYVTPSGARAASAGVMIMNAADVAAMAPGTNIGAAHPVTATGEDVPTTMEEKVVNDMVANAKSIAEKKGRNPEWVERAIRESVSATENEALKLSVIDMVAKNREELLRKIDGRKIEGKGIIHVKGATVSEVSETWRERLLRTIADPTIAYVLLLMGAAGLYFEFSNPGMVLPGVLGAISLVLAAYALQVLPVNYVGVILILLAIVFFVMESQIASHGALSMGGVLALAFGSLMLYDRSIPGMRVAYPVVIATVSVCSLFFITMATLVFRAHTRKPKTGEEGLVGETGTVRRVKGNKALVIVHGEIWNAVVTENLEEGDHVEVTAVDGLTLAVKRIRAKS